MPNEHDVIASVWNAHDDETYRRDQSHWRGVGRWANDAAWTKIGDRSLARVNSLLSLIGHKDRLFADGLTMLEWGPGGGANAYAFRRLARQYYGVDISEKNLAECQRMLSLEECAAFAPVHLAGEPLTIVESIKDPIDVFLSTAVFQHFPNKDYGRRVLTAIRSVSSPNAIGFIQIRYDNGRKKYRGNIDISEYHDRHIYANSYKIDEFWSLCAECDFEPLCVREISDKANYATFYMRAA